MVRRDFEAQPYPLSPRLFTQAGGEVVEYESEGQDRADPTPTLDGL
jgi:hypothetical protein